VSSTENYVRPVVTKLEELLPDCEPDLIRLYALLAVTLGTTAVEEDVHAAWAVWCDATNPRHRSLVPFADLTPEVQQLDTPYVRAIRAAALAKDGAR
jgi:hypothetical protein